MKGRKSWHNYKVESSAASEMMHNHVSYMRDVHHSEKVRAHVTDSTHLIHPPLHHSLQQLPP